MNAGKLIKDRRLQLGFGVRETARKTAHPFVPHPISSPVYISRLEAGDSKYLPTDSVTIDKLWGLGVVLCMHPMLLFLASRGREFNAGRVWAVDTCDPQEFCVFLRSRRYELNISIREAAAQASEVSGWYMSFGYWSQLETGMRDMAGVLSGEKLWAISLVIDVDPLLLYVLSRRIDPRLLSPDSRMRLFS